MSGAPKRLHEEGTHPTSSKRSLDDNSIFPNSSGKLGQSISSEYHLPIEPGHDGRMAKIQRTESRDADKRSSPLPLHRISSSSNDSCLDHPIASENRPELRESKDNRDAKMELRETKSDKKETWDFRIERVMDPQVSKGEKDIRIESRGNDEERKSDKEFKGEFKSIKDNVYHNDPHLDWKEHKEDHRGKRYSEPPFDTLDPWRISWNNLPTTNENGKESSSDDWKHLEAHETVGKNKVDLKGEEKFKDKERKRKKEKHRDWGDMDSDRNDCRNNSQLATTSTDHRVSSREERDNERCERERKDVMKDKELPKEREKDHTKKETLNGNEKDSLQKEEELAHGSLKMPEQESPAIAQKRYKESDNWISVDRDVKDRKREKDTDVEGDRQEKHSRYEKESDDGCTEGDGVTEWDREVFSYGVQQRRRMLRPRGTTPSASREPRFRPRTCDNEGSQGKPEVSSVVYKVGECKQELVKLWKEFEASQESKNDESSQNGPTLEIRIPVQYVTATNRQVRGGQLWGTDIYTDDSDLVAVLMHTGYCHPTASSPPPAIHELRATICVLPPQDCYMSTLRNNVRSRAWGAAIGCSYCVERCCIVKKGGGTIDLEPSLTHISAVEPTLAPVAVELTMTAGAAASNALRQQKFVREVTIQYNLCNEPWLKYIITVVADEGLKKPLYTSARLKKGEVLYLETHSNRYELCFNGEKAVGNGSIANSQVPDSESDKFQNRSSHGHASDGHSANCERIIDVFRWSRCKKPLPQKVMLSIGVPLPVEYLEVLGENLDWEDVQWSQTGVWVAGKEYPLARVHFLSPN